jgi:hypothetical protein
MNQIQEHYGQVIVDWVADVLNDRPQPPLIVLGPRGCGKSKLWQALQNYTRVLVVDRITTFNYPLRDAKVIVSEEFVPDWITDRFIRINKQMEEPTWLFNRMSWIGVFDKLPAKLPPGPVSIVELPGVLDPTWGPIFPALFMA